jgi:uncharacterized protein YoxC
MVLTVITVILSLAAIAMSMLALATVHSLDEQLKNTTARLERLDKDLRG